MGCDIHVYGEIRFPGAREWMPFVPELAVVGNLGPRVESGTSLTKLLQEGIFLNPSLRNRNYSLFGVLAGVRKEVEPLVPLRGWPLDATMEELPEAVENHSYTWYGSEELEELWKRKGRRLYVKLTKADWADWADCPSNKIPDPPLIVFNRKLIKNARAAKVEIRFLIVFDN